IVHGVVIGADSVIGAGSVVLRDVPDRVVGWGAPFEVRRPRKSDEPYLAPKRG
ncbi:MAG: hypothetical protein IT285_10555, partial [Bdellovibrionales bacterium]|nr:hypothetical protein [Bdellovibrionales bacterium]